MIEFDGWRVPQDFNNDGCTCAPDNWFGIDLYPACNMHDFHSRYLVHDGHMKVQEADWIFRNHLIYLGVPGIIARLYWISVKVVRPFRKDRAKLPEKWSQYAVRSNGNVTRLA